MHARQLAAKYLLENGLTIAYQKSLCQPAISPAPFWSQRLLKLVSTRGGVAHLRTPLQVSVLPVADAGPAAVPTPRRPRKVVMQIRRSQFTRLIACILLPCYLVACMSWKTQEASPQQVLADEQPDKVQVTLTDGSQLVLKEPAVSGDTLSGLDDSTPVHIPLANVSSIAVEGTNAAKTGLAVVGGLALVAGLIALGFYIFVCEGQDAC